MFYVYVLQNKKGKLYKGFTSDLKKRVFQHNTKDGFHSWTHANGEWKLVYSEEYENEKEARNREKFFKSGVGRDFLREKIGRVSAAADG